MAAAANLPMLACTRSSGATTAAIVAGKMPCRGSALLFEVKRLDVAEGARHAAPADTVNIKTYRCQGSFHPVGSGPQCNTMTQPWCIMWELADDANGAWELADTTADI